jgi:DNA repair protein RecO (recombination protein O)
MPMERAEALVLRTTDWSESSRIATLWTRERGKVRALAKGGRRLRSAFESALDLLTHCGIVLLHKTTGGLDLLTEAQVIEVFPRLRGNLQAYYGGCYLAELLADGTQDLDPHPDLFDAALTTLRSLGDGLPVGQELAGFELVWLRELGFQPVLDTCAGCGGELAGEGLSFSCAAGGVLCPDCRTTQSERRPLSAAAWRALCELNTAGGKAGAVWEERLRREVRPILEQVVSYHLGRRPRSLNFLDRPRTG